MSSSTPQSAGRKGDASFDSVFVSPGTRRQPVSASGTPVLESCPGNDDEQERKQRRRSRVIDLQFSAESPLLAQSPTSKQRDTSLPAIPQLSNAQIADHYSVCIKLSTENKITTKNAFGLHLIDYLTEILKQKDSELTNFKVAAGSLDASAKIYAVRVDAVHADVYKVLGGLAKDSEPAEAVGGPETGGGDADSENSKKQQSKKKHQRKTVEQNLNNINVSEAEDRCRVDPMFQRTVSSFDECSTAGVFLTSLHTHNYLSEVLFDSVVTPLPSSSTSESPPSSQVEVADLKSILLQCVDKRPICPSLAGFAFTQWDSEIHNESVSALLEKFKKSDQAFDINAETNYDAEDYAEGPAENDFDADAPDQTDGMDLGEFSEKLESCRIGPGSSRKDVVLLGKGEVESMCTHLSMNPSEYSYFSPRIMSAWAGPEHWRFKPRHKGDANSERASKRRLTKKVFEIHFDDEIEFEIHFRKTKARITLAKSTLESQNKKRNTLPEDFHYDMNSLTCLFLKPVNRLCKEPLQGKSPSHDDEAGEYDYNNPNDTSNFCPALQEADSDDEGDPGVFMGHGGVFEMTANPERVAGQEAGLNGGIATYSESVLVAEPQKVNKIEIQYAKMAKKMDMKRLKQTMWCLLTDAQPSQAEEVCVAVPSLPVASPPATELARQRALIGRGKPVVSLPQQVQQRSAVQSPREILTVGCTGAKKPDVVLNRLKPRPECPVVKLRADWPLHQTPHSPHISPQPILLSSITPARSPNPALPILPSPSHAHAAPLFPLRTRPSPYHSLRSPRHLSGLLPASLWPTPLVCPWPCIPRKTVAQPGNGLLSLLLVLVQQAACRTN